MGGPQEPRPRSAFNQALRTKDKAKEPARQRQGDKCVIIGGGGGIVFATDVATLLILEQPRGSTPSVLPYLCSYTCTRNMGMVPVCGRFGPCDGRPHPSQREHASPHYTPSSDLCSSYVCVKDENRVEPLLVGSLRMQPS